MASGVGIVAVVAGSVPRIAGPRPAEEPPPADRPAPAPADARHEGRFNQGPAPSSSSVLPQDGSRGPVAPFVVRAAGSAGPARSERAAAALPVSPKEVVGRVAQALSSAPIRDGSRIRLALSPANLGELLIELSVSGSRVRARVRTQTGAARELILSHLDDLRRELDRRGLRIVRFEVEVDGATKREGEGAAVSPAPRSHRRQVLDLEA